MNRFVINFQNQYLILVGLILLLPLAVTVQTGSIKQLLTVFIVSAFVLSIPITLCTDRGESALKKLLQRDFLGISFAVGYAIFLVAIIVIENIKFQPKVPISITFILFLVTICAFFGLSHKREGSASFSRLDLLILIGLSIIYYFIQISLPPKTFIAYPPLISIGVALRLLPCIMALMIFIAKRNIDKVDIGYDFGFSVRDGVYLTSFLLLTIAILLLSQFPFGNFLATFSVKDFIFRTSLMAFIAALPEEIFFRLLLMNMLIGFFKKKLNSNLGLFFSIVISSLLFGIYHVKEGIWQAFWATVWGGQLGTLFVLRKRLSGPVILHSIINGILWS